MGIELYCDKLDIEIENTKNINSNFSSISKIEAGTRAVSAEEILYLSFAIDKTIMYFYPEKISYELNEEELTVLEKELLNSCSQFRMR